MTIGCVVYFDGDDQIASKLGVENRIDITHLDCLHSLVQNKLVVDPSTNETVCLFQSPEPDYIERVVYGFNSMKRTLFHVAQYVGGPFNQSSTGQQLTGFCEEALTDLAENARYVVVSDSVFENTQVNPPSYFVRFAPIIQQKGIMRLVHVVNGLVGSPKNLVALMFAAAGIDVTDDIPQIELSGDQKLAAVLRQPATSCEQFIQATNKQLQTASKKLNPRLIVAGKFEKTAPEQAEQVADVKRYQMGSKLVPQGAKGCLAGITFCRTGELSSMTEKVLVAYLVQLGGSFAGSVTNKVQYLLVGSAPGETKMSAAEDKGVEILKEIEFFDLIQQKSLELLGPAYAKVPFAPPEKCEAISNLDQQPQAPVAVKEEPIPQKESLKNSVDIPQPDFELGAKVVKGPKGCLKGMDFVRTGELRTMTEGQLSEWLAYHGGSLGKGVTKSTAYVVVGAAPGDTKLNAAKKNGVPLVDEKQLFQLVLDKGGEWVENKRSVNGWK